MIFYLVPITAFASLCPALTRNLSRGSEGTDVRSLQQFLADEGELTDDAVTGAYGPLTERAVKHWQTAARVVSSGSPSTTGWGAVGPKTRAAIMASCEKGGSNLNRSRGPGVFTSSLLSAASSSSSSGISLSKCPKVPVPAQACGTRWQNIAGKDGCVRFWYCVGTSVTSLAAPLRSATSTSSSGATANLANSYRTTYQFVSGNLTLVGTTTQNTCWTGIGCGSGSSTSTPTGGYFQYWCQNGPDPATGYWSQTPCQGYSPGEGGTYGSYGGGREGAACAPEGGSSFIACPYMQNCFGGGTYLTCRNAVWVRTQ